MGIVIHMSSHISIVARLSGSLLYILAVYILLSVLLLLHTALYTRCTFDVTHLYFMIVLSHIFMSSMRENY